ncbi:hypothetical protein NQ318_004178 [Aromia moschata]|uniref:Uncharacterized protein n=1 Tax=Aromia moschata TaxID=1265417 RepID=A0AAV8XMW6_9CUCU|nr:hypothetical protein NQ318_004178 [Aromia moschata]
MLKLPNTLRDILLYRSECKILETDEYNYWHQSAKKEMTRLQKYITKEELMEYMRHCDKDDTDVIDLDNRISTKLNNLKHLLVERELIRHDEDKYLRYCKEIKRKWQILIKDVPVGHLIESVSFFLNMIKENLHMLSMPDQ